MVIISKTQFVAVALANAVVLTGDLVETLADLVSGDLLAAAQSLILGLV